MQSARVVRVLCGWLSVLFIAGGLLVGLPTAMYMAPPAISFTFLIAVMVVLLIGVVMAIGFGILTALIAIERRLIT